ncbi:MAG: hypothetical protein JOZ02_08425 [Acidobacteria bacterium]|nr:hypothetical protein [Acidobacteriota bacterium]
MADNVQPDAGEQREESSGLLLSVDPLQGANNYKLAGGDSDGSDKGGLLGDDSSDSDGSDSTLGGDDSDASDADGTDGGDSDGTDSGDSDGSDADGTDVADADGTDTGLDADGMNPLGIGTGDADAK